MNFSKFSSSHNIFFFCPKFTNFGYVFSARFHITLKHFPINRSNSSVAIVSKKIENVNFKIVRKLKKMHKCSEKLTNSFYIKRKKIRVIDMQNKYSQHLLFV